MEYSFDYFKKSSDYVLEKIGYKPEIGIILGSALGPFASQIENKIVIKYKDIPNFLTTSVESHAGELVCGEISGKKVACMSGRFHYYEGYDFEQLTAPIRLFKLLGCKASIITNAAGGVNLSYKVGDIMIIADQIKMNGASPLRGKNIKEFGDRFFDTSDMYTKKLRELAKEVAKDSPITFHEGTYFFMPGPQFETPAEIRAIRTLGGDTVGMSTVYEAITAAHCKMPCLGFSVVSNMAAGVTGQELTDEEVGENGKKIANEFSAYMKQLIAKM